LPIAVLLLTPPYLIILAAQTLWSLAGCLNRPELGYPVCPCDPFSSATLSIALRIALVQGLQASVMPLIFVASCFPVTRLGVCFVLFFPLLFFGLALTGNDQLPNAIGFSLLAFASPLVSIRELGCHAGWHAALPIVVVIVYIGVIQILLGRIYPDLAADTRPVFVAIFPLLLSALQRVTRKVLSRLPALRSRDEWGAGRWPAHAVATLAALFFAFGQSLNLAVLVAGSMESLGAVLLNVGLRSLMGISSRVCLTWRLKRWLARQLGRSLSWNPRKMCRRQPPEKFGPKTCVPRSRPLDLCVAPSPAATSPAATSPAATCPLQPDAGGSYCAAGETA
jgi:hypothetical protein